MDPLSSVLVTAGVALVVGFAGGLAGGLGGRRAQRRSLRELEDDVEQLDRRMSRREGQAGQERVRARADADQELRELLLARVGQGAGGRANGSPPTTHAEIMARARAQGAHRPRSALEE